MSETANAQAGCPASPSNHLGSASGCLSVTLNPNGTGTLTNPPSGTSAVFDVPPSEDTLILIVNNSGQTVNTIHISSNLNIFGFDGDGTQSNSNGALNNYLGPKNTFANISGTQGDVNFTGGLANGTSTFFGLEEPLNAASFGVTVGVPGPIAGAGLPGLIVACGGLLGWLRRRRSQSA